MFILLAAVNIISGIGGHEKCIQNFSPEYDGERLLGTTSLRLEVYVKIQLRAVGCEVVDRIIFLRIEHSAFMSTVMDL
jgi:hypothetical protein